MRFLLLSMVAQVLWVLFFTPLASASCPPTQAPAALQPSGTILEDRPTIKWTAVNGAQSYTLYVLRVSDEAIILRKTGLTATSFRPASPLPSNIDLRWKVKGESSCGPGPYSPSTYFRVSGGGVPCPPTQAPVANGPSGTITDSRPTFAWQPVPGAQTYTLYILRVSDEAIILRKTGLTATSFRPAAPLPSNVDLRWKVKGESPCGPGPYSPSIYFRVNVNGPPCPPTQAPVAEGPSGNTSDSTPTFSWRSVPGAETYTLYVLRVSDEAILLRATGITGLEHTPGSPLPSNVELRWKVKGESVCGPGPYSSSTYFEIDAPSQLPIDFGYYNVDTVRYGFYMNEVTGHTNLVYIGPSDAGTSETPPQERKAQLAELVQRAAAAGMAIMLDIELGGPLTVGDVLLAARPHWNSVKYVILDDEPSDRDFTIAQVNAEIDSLRQRMRNLGLDDSRPVGVTLTPNVTLQDQIIFANWDFINIEAYTQPCSCQSCGAGTAQAEIQAVANRVAQMKARIPSSKFLTVVMQGYDRNGAFTNIPVLAALNRATYFSMVRRDPRVRAIVVFSYGRRGNQCPTGPNFGFGTRGHPELLSVHHEIWEDINDLAGSPAVAVLDMTANGGDGPIEIRSADPLSTSIALDAGAFAGDEADWWIIVESPMGWYYLDFGAGWLEGIAVSYQGALVDLAPFETFSGSGLPAGTYTFYFAVDMVANGEIDHDQLYADAVVVNVKP
jgi:hypothetical protein